VRRCLDGCLVSVDHLAVSVVDQARVLLLLLLSLRAQHSVAVQPTHLHACLRPCAAVPGRHHAIVDEDSAEAVDSFLSHLMSCTTEDSTHHALLSIYCEVQRALASSNLTDVGSFAGSFTGG
jgi:hypothetical protein